MGRFLSVDPLVKKYAGWSPYVFAQDKPTRYIDIDGGEIPEEEPAAESWREEGYESEEDWVQTRQARLRRSENEDLERERSNNEAKAKKDPIWRQWRDQLQHYARGAVEVAPSVFGETPSVVYPRITVNKGNGAVWEKAIGEIIAKNPNYTDIIKQVSLKVTGTMQNGAVFTANVRIDIAGIQDNGIGIDLYEAKYSVEEITVNNVKQTFTKEQAKMDKIFQNAESINFQVRGNSLAKIGIKAGTDITAKITGITLVSPQGTAKPAVTPAAKPKVPQQTTNQTLTPKKKG